MISKFFSIFVLFRIIQFACSFYLSTDELFRLVSQKNATITTNVQLLLANEATNRFPDSFRLKLNPFERNITLKFVKLGDDENPISDELNVFTIDEQTNEIVKFMTKDQGIVIEAIYIFFFLLF